MDYHLLQFLIQDFMVCGSSVNLENPAQRRCELTVAAAAFVQWIATR
jgi:hypothetical protein